MTEEEKKTVEFLKEIVIEFDKCNSEYVIDKYDEYGFLNGFRVVLNLIEKLQKEIEDFQKARKNGTLSDGYHTFNDLYYQRCVLFATICNMNKNISWKSKRHSDGNKCFDSDNWFIVGIDTPEGSYTYHYGMKYWDLFEVQELELGKVWDGHTEKDVTRLLSLINNNISKYKIRKLLEKLNLKLDKLKQEMDKEYDMYGKSSVYLDLDEQLDYLYEIKELLEEE